MRALFLSIILLALTFSSSFAQRDDQASKELWSTCPIPLPSISASDTVAWQTSVDSVSVMMAGKWKLLETSNGWCCSSKPGRPVELILNRAGDGELYEAGILASKIKLRIRRMWGRILFDFEQTGKSITFSPGLFEHGRSLSPKNPRRNEGALSVCPYKLIISNNYADGSAFVFERTPN